ncbi:MAG TPA: lytic transglycosylase domain-containing protein [Terracidiphilus sp.]|nr:lytic transglycosylase domain-containing protein [Terracidiphilus sp.]
MRLIFSAAVCAASTLMAQAGERVLLKNGFEMRCDHHVQAGASTRLYLSSEGNNYIELRSDEIAAVAQVPDAAPHSQDTPDDAVLSPADLHEMLARAGRDHNLDVDLLASVVKAESNGNTRAVSRAGARGLMQLMPSTAVTLGVKDSFQPDDNVQGGSAYLDELLTRYHNSLAKALAAYNAGPGAVDRYHGIPPYRETRTYVARVIHEFNRRVMAREVRSRRAAESTQTTSSSE